MILASTLLDAEVRIGQLFKELPKASGGKPFHTSCSGATSKPTKDETIKNLGFKKTQAHRFETLAEHPEIVEQVKAVSLEIQGLQPFAFKKHSTKKK